MLATWYDAVAVLAVLLGDDLLPTEHPNYAAALQRIAARQWVYGRHHSAAELRAAIIDAVDFPPLSDMDRFRVERSDTWAAREALRLYRDCPPITRGVTLAGWEYDALMCEANRLYLAWDALDDAVMYGRMLSNVYMARAALARLRERIGDEAYYRGEMP